MASWWVIPEGTIGKSVSQIIHDFESGSPSSVQGIGSLYTVTQSATRPAGAMSGPYATQALAQAAAGKLNGTITASTAQTPKNVVSGAEGWASLFQGSIWIRVAEVVIGITLMAIGVAQLTKVVPIATKIAKVVK